MNGKERIDYLLKKVPEDKKEAFVEDLKGVASLEEGLSYRLCGWNPVYIDSPVQLACHEFTDFEQPFVRPAYEHAEEILSAEQRIGNIPQFFSRKLLPAVNF